MILHHVEQMALGGSASNSMRLVRVQHEIKLLTCFDERRNKLDTVLEVHVVIACSVDQKQCTMEILGGLRKSRLVVSLGVVVGKSEIAFHVRRIIVAGVGDRSNR